MTEKSAFVWACVALYALWGAKYSQSFEACVALVNKAWDAADARK